MQNNQMCPLYYIYYMSNENNEDTHKHTLTHVFDAKQQPFTSFTSKNLATESVNGVTR